MNVDWGLLADYALVDQRGKLSLIGIFNRLWTPSFPSLQPTVFLAFALTGEASRSAMAELRVWGPTKDLLVGGQQQVMFGTDGRASSIFQLAPLPLPAPGVYIFELLLDGTSAAHLELNVEQASQV